MLLLRKTTMAPVLGVGMGFGFWGQIDLDGWSWNMNNPKAVKDLKAADKKKSEDLDERKMQKLLEKAKNEKDPEKKNDLIEKASFLKKMEVSEKDKRKAAEADSESNKLKFTFSKRLDTASTQMLNMMKSGSPFQLATVTVVHRAGVWSKIPGFLSIQFFDLLITGYDISVSQDESNTEITEEWEAEFNYVTFAYSRRIDPLAPSNIVSTGLGKMMFVMKPRGPMV